MTSTRTPPPVPLARVPGPMRPGPEAPWFTATPATGARQPGARRVGRTRARSSSACPAGGTSGCRISAPSFTPSAGAELQSEYLLPVEHAVPAMHALSRDQRPAWPRCCGSARSVSSRRTSCGSARATGQDSVALPLHLDRRHGRGAAGGHADGTAAGPVRRRGRTGARSSPPPPRPCTPATTACPTSWPSPATTTPPASSATPTPPAT